MSSRAIAQPAFSQAGIPGAAGAGLDTGGAANTIPYKASATDYDTAWTTTVTLADDEYYSGILFYHPLYTNITAAADVEGNAINVDIVAEPTLARFLVTYGTHTVRAEATATDATLLLSGGSSSITLDGVDYRAVGRVTETKTDDYTLVTADAGKLFLFDKATAVDCDVDTALNLTPGQQIEFIQIGAGELTLVAGAGVTVNTPATLSLAAQYCKATLTCTATDVYVLNGELATP